MDNEVIFRMQSEIITTTLNLEHPSVKEVIAIAEDILNQNKVLNIQSLYNKAKKQLKIPKKGLVKIISLLLNKKILIEGSKYTKKTVLTNRVRYRILKYIEGNGAAYFSEIRRNILADDGDDLGSGQLIWHLEMLLKFKYIKKIKVGNYSVFLPIYIDDETGEIIFLLNDKVNREITKALLKREPIKQSEIYKIVSYKRENVYYRIKNLIFHQIIVVKEEINSVISINPQKKNLVIQIIQEIRRIQDDP